MSRPFHSVMSAPASHAGLEPARCARKARATFLSADIRERHAVSIAWLLALLSFCGVLHADLPRRPNIIVILADDLGYGDVHCYNPERGKIPTPNLDRLAQEGMRFLDAHCSSGVCSPSRYTLLTGRYHWRTRLQRGIVGYLERPLIAEDRLTIAGMAKQVGYHTACIGKWHLGWNWPIPKGERKWFAPKRGTFPQATAKHREMWARVYSQPIADGPTTRGFDEYFGTDVPNWPPYCFIQNDRTVGIPSVFLPKELFRNHLASLPGPALPDWDLAAVLPTLAERACDYVRRRAATGRPFLLYLPLTSPHTPVAVARRWRGESGLGVPVADFIMQTDAVVGRLLDAVRDSEIEDNTLIIFTSDNGFAPYVDVNKLLERGHDPSGPLRGYKGDGWEGGHRIPFLVRWPGVVPEGSVCRQLVHHADVMATLAEILEFELPHSAGEDSYSFLPLLKGSREPIRTHAVSQSAQGMLTLREGSWKLLMGRGGGGPWSRFSAEPTSNEPAQLYDLSVDLGEQHNLYAKHPDRVERMVAALRELVERGRSTPGPRLKNDVPVNWKKFYKHSSQP